MSTVVGVITGLVLFLGGLYLFAVAFQVPVDYAKWVFVSGIAAVSLSFAIPFHLLANNERS